MITCLAGARKAPSQPWHFCPAIPGPASSGLHEAAISAQPKTPPSALEPLGTVQVDAPKRAVLQATAAASLAAHDPVPPSATPGAFLRQVRSWVNAAGLRSA